MSKANINHTPKRWSADVETGPCNQCNYREHCAGRVDAVTGAERVSPDDCEAYQAYSNRQRYQGKDQTPYRVKHSLIIQKNIQRQELIASC